MISERIDGFTEGAWRPVSSTVSKMTKAIIYEKHKGETVKENVLACGGLSDTDVQNGYLVLFQDTSPDNKLQKLSVTVPKKSQSYAYFTLLAESTKTPMKTDAYGNYIIKVTFYDNDSKIEAIRDDAVQSLSWGQFVKTTLVGEYVHLFVKKIEKFDNPDKKGSMSTGLSFTGSVLSVQSTLNLNKFSTKDAESVVVQYTKKEGSEMQYGNVQFGEGGDIGYLEHVECVPCPCSTAKEMDAYITVVVTDQEQQVAVVQVLQEVQSQFLFKLNGLQSTADKMKATNDFAVCWKTSEHGLLLKIKTTWAQASCNETRALAHNIDGMYHGVWDVAVKFLVYRNQQTGKHGISAQLRDAVCVVPRKDYLQLSATARISLVEKQTQTSYTDFDKLDLQKYSVSKEVRSSGMQIPQYLWDKEAPMCSVRDLKVVFDPRQEQVDSGSPLNIQVTGCNNFCDFVESLEMRVQNDMKQILCKEVEVTSCVKRKEPYPSNVKLKYRPNITEIFVQNEDGTVQNGTVLNLQKNARIAVAYLQVESIWYAKLEKTCYISFRMNKVYVKEAQRELGDGDVCFPNKRKRQRIENNDEAAKEQDCDHSEQEDMVSSVSA